jgi:hypothetical protein
VWRSGADFQRFAFSEYARFRKIVVENDLQER